MTTWKVFVDWDRDYDFTDSYDEIWDDVISMEWRRGIRKAYDHIASNDTCTIKLDNSTGKYNPDNAAGTLYGKLLPHRQVRIQAITASGTVDMWRGWIDSLSSEWQPSGSYTGLTYATLDCVGAKAYMQNFELNLALQENKRTDQIIARVLQEAVLPPSQFANQWLIGIPGFSELGTTTRLGDFDDYATLDTGYLMINTYGDIRDIMKDNTAERNKQQEQTAYRIMRDIAEAEAGRLFFSEAGKAIFHSRNRVLDYASNVGTVGTGGKLPTAMDVRFGEYLANRVQVHAFPRVTENAVTLWDLDENIIIPAGGTVQVDAPFTDSNSRRCGGKSPNLSSPTFSAGSASVTPVWKAERGEFAFINSGTVDATLTGLSVTGIALMSNNQIVIDRIDQDSLLTYGKRTPESLILRALDNYADAEDRADHTLDMFKEPFTHVNDVSFTSKADGTANAHQLSWLIGDQLRVITGTGHDARYTIIGSEHRITGGGLLHETTYQLERKLRERLAYHNPINRDGGTDYLNTSASPPFTKLAQSFQSSYAQTVDHVRIFMRAEGSPGGTVSAILYSGSTAPSAALTNGTADTLMGTAIQTNYRWQTFTFTTPPSLSAGTTYWLELSANFSAGTVSYMTWGHDSSGAYASGTLLGYDSYWQATTKDGIFEVFAPPS